MNWWQLRKLHNGTLSETPITTPHLAKAVKYLGRGGPHPSRGIPHRQGLRPPRSDLTQLVSHIYFIVLLTNQMFIHKDLLISLGLDSSLITKVSLHNFPPPDPPFSPPQTFSKLKAVEKGKTLKEDTYMFILYGIFNQTKHNQPNKTKQNKTKPN